MTYDLRAVTCDHCGQTFEKGKSHDWRRVSGEGLDTITEDGTFCDACFQKTARPAYNLSPQKAPTTPNKCKGSYMCPFLSKSANEPVKCVGVRNCELKSKLSPLQEAFINELAPLLLKHGWKKDKWGHYQITPSNGTPYRITFKKKVFSLQYRQFERVPYMYASDHKRVLAWRMVGKWVRARSGYYGQLQITNGRITGKLLNTDLEDLFKTKIVFPAEVAALFCNQLHPHTFRKSISSHVIVNKIEFEVSDAKGFEESNSRGGY